MGKNYLSILTLLLAFGLNLSAQTKTSSPALTKENANKIIGMTNCVIDIYNDQISEVRDVADCLKRFDNSMNKVAENPNAAAHGASCANIRDLRTDLVSQLQKKAALAPSFPEKKAILEGIEQLNTEFATAKERCKVIQAYLTSKKYLEDDKNFSNYTALRSSFVESYDKINDMFDKTMDLSTAAGDRAELVILKSHPLASVVIPMKTSLSAVSQIMSKCRAEKPNVEAIKAEVAAVRKNIEKDKVITPAKKTALAKANNGEIVFDRFYESTAGALDKVDLYLEYLDPNKEITVDTVLKETKEDALNRHLKRQYGEIQKYYGYMVDAYNTL